MSVVALQQCSFWKLSPKFDNFSLLFQPRNLQKQLQSKPTITAARAKNNCQLRQSKQFRTILLWRTTWLRTLRNQNLVIYRLARAKGYSRVPWWKRSVVATPSVAGGGRTCQSRTVWAPPTRGQAAGSGAWCRGDRRPASGCRRGCGTAGTCRAATQRAHWAHGEHSVHGEHTEHTESTASMESTLSTLSTASMESTLSTRRAHWAQNWQRAHWAHWAHWDHSVHGEHTEHTQSTLSTELTESTLSTRRAQRPWRAHWAHWAHWAQRPRRAQHQQSAQRREHIDTQFSTLFHLKLGIRSWSETRPRIIIQS